MIDFCSETLSFSIDNEEQVSKWIQNTIAEEKKETGAISIIFCSDEFLIEMNKKHLSHDYYTDIITFDYTEASIISGDLFISIDRVKSNSKSLYISFLDELHRVIIHGILHLLAYNDKSDDDKALMTEKEDYYLSLRPFAKV